MSGSALLAPPVAFAVFLAISGIINYVGKVIADDRGGTGLHREAYASGEAPPEASAPRYRLYHLGIGFTIVHVAVLLLATAPLDLAGLIVGLPVAAILGIAMAALGRTVRSTTPH
ncbi:hypothetical protein HARCEL1_02955 [Halococcoides cellulosivorans]|uniref:Uncharacterized protein n=1 Tax=Halococcoides cellulosivorans TaxID=1679096 RepID=A0A2R4WZ07_9EURY|nr:hypothetical protein HARCEL1_02955 [Halococcoides cellulosivorans]